MGMRTTVPLAPSDTRRLLPASPPADLTNRASSRLTALVSSSSMASAATAQLLAVTAAGIRTAKRLCQRYQQMTACTAVTRCPPNAMKLPATRV